MPSPAPPVALAMTLRPRRESAQTRPPAWKSVHDPARLRLRICFGADGAYVLEDRAPHPVFLVPEPRGGPRANRQQARRGGPPPCPITRAPRGARQPAGRGLD